MFQIICKSNDSLNYYPNNKSNNFQVKIPHLSNKGYNLEVALAEIIIPSKVKNVRQGHNTIEIHETIKQSHGIPAHGNYFEKEMVHTFAIEPNSYTLNSLIAEINQHVFKVGNFLKLGLDKINN